MENLNDLIITKEDIKASIENQGVPVDVGLKDYGDKIRLIYPTKIINGMKLGRSTFTTVNIDTSNVTDMSYMFYQCESLKTILKLDTSSAMWDMSYMFAGCESLETIPPLDTSRVELMIGTFKNCKSLKNILSLDISPVGNTQSMFSGCESLETIPPLDTSNVVYMSSMFAGCKKLKEIKVDLGNALTGDFLFYGCESLSKIYLKGDPKRLKEYDDMFKGVSTRGTLYYDKRYNYSKILEMVPVTWKLQPYNFG